MALSLWHDSPTISSLKSELLNLPADGQLVIKSLYSLISSGTERLVATGMVPSDSFEKMSVPYMKGSFSFPVKYGYSLVGQVVNEGKYKGEFVHLLHPHQEECLVSAEDIYIFSKAIPPKRATLASNLETALNAVWDSKVSMGDKVLVAGFGMIGGLVARLLSFIPAVEVVILEVDEHRIQLGKKMGFEVVDRVQTKDFDISFNTTANETALQHCIESVGKEGVIVELSWYGEKKVTLDLGASFHHDRKKIMSSQVSSLPQDRLSRWDFKRRKDIVFDLLKNDIFDHHITDEITLMEAPDFFSTLRNNKFKGLACTIKY